jgi:hypothetical protein
VPAASFGAQDCGSRRKLSARIIALQHSCHAREYL